MATRRNTKPTHFRYVQAGQQTLLPAGAVNIFKPCPEAPSGSNQAPVQSYIGNFPQRKYEADHILPPSNDVEVEEMEVHCAHLTSVCCE